MREVCEELDIAVRVLLPFTTVEHSYSHFRITLHVFHCKCKGGNPGPIGCERFRWIRPAELTTLPFAPASLKVIRKLLQVQEERSSDQSPAA